MYRGTSVKSNTKEGEIKKLQKQLRRLENQYGQLLESCKPNPEVCTKLVEFIDSKLLQDPFVYNNAFSK